MGRYIDWQDAVDRYQRIGDKGSVDVGSNYIVYAEAEIESKLAPAFTVPFSSNNLTVKDLCIDMTLAKILMFKDTKKAEMIMGSIDARVKALLDGTAQMVTTSGVGQAIENHPYWSETMDYHPTFGAGNLLDFHVSSDRLYDEEQARD